TDAPSCTVNPVRAKTVPTTVPSIVPEPPASQNTLQARAPFASVMLAPLPVVIVESVLTMKVASALPPASSVTPPDTSIAPDTPYTPGLSVPLTLLRVAVTVLEATVSSAASRSARACDVSLPVWIVPVTWLVRPLTVLPPTSPVTDDVPEPVTDPLASTA